MDYILLASFRLSTQGNSAEVVPKLFFLVTNTALFNLLLKTGNVEFKSNNYRNLKKCLEWKYVHQSIQSRG